MGEDLLLSQVEVPWFVAIVDEIPRLLYEIYPQLNLSALPPPQDRIRFDPSGRLARRACQTSINNPTQTNSQRNSSPSSSSTTSNSSNSGNTALLVGSIIGAVGGVVIIAAIVFFFYRRHKHRQATKLKQLVAQPNNGAGPLPDGSVPAMKQQLSASYGNPTGFYPNMNGSMPNVVQAPSSSGYTPSSVDGISYYGAQPVPVMQSTPGWINNGYPISSPAPSSNPALSYYSATPAPTFGSGSSPTPAPPPFTPPPPSEAASFPPWGPSTSFSSHPPPTVADVPSYASPSMPSEKAQYSGYSPSTEAPAWHPDSKGQPSSSNLDRLQSPPPHLPPYSPQ